LDIPIIVYGGEKEANVDETFLNRWKELSLKEDLFVVRMFPGNHNFQVECQTQVLEALKKDFNNLINK
jgi:surfactin synthase thioesterase subunit